MEFKLHNGSGGLCCKSCSRQDKKLNTYDWLADIPGNAEESDMVEVQFKNTRKGYYRNSNKIKLEKGDIVAVEATPGHDIGTVTLTGRLVPLQMKKANFKQDAEIKRIYRKAKAVDMEKYEEANALLKKIPDTVIDATIMKTSVLAHQEGTDTAALFLEGKLLQAVINIQSYLYKLIEMEEETGNHDKAEKIAEITDHMISLFGLWNYGNTVPYLLIAGYRKDVEKCIQLIKRLLSESQKPWNMTQSPLYYRYEDTAQGKAFSGIGKNFVRELYSEIENKKEYEFLRGNKELESIFEEHLK